MEKWKIIGGGTSYAFSILDILMFKLACNFHFPVEIPKKKEKLMLNGGIKNNINRWNIRKENIPRENISWKIIHKFRYSVFWLRVQRNVCLDGGIYEQRSKSGELNLLKIITWRYLRLLRDCGGNSGVYLNEYLFGEKEICWRK
jgi:hypothetical protein